MRGVTPAPVTLASMAVERLSVLDSSFLSLESSSHHMHVGGLGIFEPGLRYADVVRVLRDRIELMPRARKRVQEHHAVIGRPVWVDDPDFDLSYHVRHAALPAPGDRHQLGEFLSRLMSRKLDRDRPLWEIYVIDGLEGDRVGLFRKVHLAMANGEDGDPFGVLLDEERLTLEAEVGRFGGAWHPDRAPSTSAAARRGHGRTPGPHAERGRRRRGVHRSARRHPTGRPGPGIHRWHGDAGQPRCAAVAAEPPAEPAPPLRHTAVASWRTSGSSGARSAARSTTSSSRSSGDAVGRLLRWRGHETKDLDLRVMVPVRVDAVVSTTRGWARHGRSATGSSVSSRRCR